VASEFGEDARRPEVEKTTGAVDSCPQSWQLLRRATESEVSHGGAVESASHAAHDREAAVSGELIRFSCRARGKVRRESSEWSPAHRRRGFLPGGTYPMATAHESQRPAINGDGPPATSEKGGKTVIFFSLEFTVPWNAPSGFLRGEFTEPITSNFVQ
jgi:hypothetical protein